MLAARAAPLDLRLEPRGRGRGQRPRRRRGQLRARPRRAGCTSTTQRGWSRWTCGAITRRSAPGRSTPKRTRSPRRTTRAGMTTPNDTPAQLAAQCARASAAMERTFAGKVLVISEFGAESNGAQRRWQPRQLLLPGAAAGRAHRRLRGRPASSRRCSCGCCATIPLTPTFRAARSTACCHSVRLIEGLNQKGLFTYGGQPKSAARTSRDCSGRCRSG